MEKKEIRKLIIAKMAEQDKQLKAQRDEELLLDVLKSTAYKDAQVIITGSIADTKALVIKGNPWHMNEVNLILRKSELAFWL